MHLLFLSLTGTLSCPLIAGIRHEERGRTKKKNKKSNKDERNLKKREPCIRRVLFFIPLYVYGDEIYVCTFISENGHAHTILGWSERDNESQVQ